MNEAWIDGIFIFMAIFLFIIFSSFSLLSLLEKERRASIISLSLGGVLAGVFSCFSLLPSQMEGWILAGTLVTFFVFGLLLLLPIGKIFDADEKPGIRVDERDIMFARARLQPGSDDYFAYYQRHPEHQSSDDLFRSEAGLLCEGSYFYNRALFAASKGSFYLTDALRNAVDGPIKIPSLNLKPNIASTYIKSLTEYYGALKVGITDIRPYHYYSHVGRGTGIYGEPIEISHTYAIAFTVEMDYDMIGSNPLAPGVMESGRQYVESAKIAICLAAAIREMGYEARAHIDGNYRLIAPLVARDAGLGELGRMGLLITPNVGPRVRLGVVTTTMPLIPDDRHLEPSVIDFCRNCKKCAENCPSQSISHQDREMIDGVLRWQINSEACFYYWTRCGTDCGRCMTICPYAHCNSYPHRVIRGGIRRSGFFRRVAVRMDDLFYGRKPNRRKSIPWTEISQDQ